MILDPVYSGKAIHHMLERMRAQPEEWHGRSAHNQGSSGLSAK